MPECLSARGVKTQRPIGISGPGIGCSRGTGAAVSARSTWCSRAVRCSSSAKARRGSGLGGPFEAVTGRKQEKLRRLAQAYLLAESRSLARIGVGDVRFDVASAIVAGDEVVVHVYEDAF